jgi:hypothetical protein
VKYVIPEFVLKTYYFLQENEGDGGESQTEGDLSDLAELSVNGPGSVDVKKEIGVKGKIPYRLIGVVDPIRIRIQQFM